MGVYLICELRNRCAIANPPLAAHASQGLEPRMRSNAPVIRTAGQGGGAGGAVVAGRTCTLHSPTGAVVAAGAWWARANHRPASLISRVGLVAVRAC